jgi:L-alanine-DL-glutamate epimerase-like enolase superfamily enzyme
MALTSRRAFLGSLLAAAPAIHAQTMSTDVRIKELSTSTEDFLYRTPIKFGGTEVDRVTLLNVKVTLESRAGKTAQGFGSMPMGNVWSFPSKTLRYDETLAAMKTLAAKVEKITRDHKEYGHPVDLNHSLEPMWLAAAQEIKLAQPIPKLCTLTTCSPFEAAIADGFGKLLNRSAYAIYGPDVMRHDLSHYLGKGFEGEYLQKYVLTKPKPSMPLYHLVGAVDPITSADIKKRINDGLPETLPEWINHSGLTNIKIKLNGEDMAWDTERVLAVDRTATEVQNQHRVADWVYSLDFNEKCPSVKYLMEMLAKIKEKTPRGYTRIQYVEQPTKRDLKADRANVMHEASKLRPVVIDESLTDLESLLLAREMGYTGAALKACKGQSQALLMAAAAQKFKMFLCVQDLTCPGASFIHSAGLAAHVPGVAAIEGNSRQYVPAANAGWDRKFPGMFDIRNGRVNTSLLKGPGLSAV